MLADVMTASETSEDRAIATVLNEAAFADAGRAQCTKATSNLCSLLARHTGSEAWGELHVNYSRRAFRAQRECVYPNAVKDVWEDKWKKMMTELGGGAKIPDLDHVGVARSLP